MGMPDRTIKCACLYEANLGFLLGGAESKSTAIGRGGINSAWFQALEISCLESDIFTLSFRVIAFPNFMYITAKAK